MDVISQHAEAFATLLSVAVALLLAWFGFRENQRRERMEYTVSVLLERFRNEHVRTARRILYERLDNDLPVRREDFSEAEFHDVMNLLAFYEFIAISTYQRRLDLPTIRRLSGNSIKRGYNGCREMVRERRESFGRPGMFRELERFVDQKLKNVD